MKFRKKLIQDVYYSRWTSTQRNLRYVIAGTGFISTEFVQPVGYAKAYGTIVAAAGHQLDESKWLRSQFYAEDYIQIYKPRPSRLNAIHRVDRTCHKPAVSSHGRLGVPGEPAR